MTHKHAVSSFNTSDRDIATRDTQTRTQGVVIIASENVFKIQCHDMRYVGLTYRREQTFRPSSQYLQFFDPSKDSMSSSMAS